MASHFAPSIGKDVIESLTLGMYEDARFIYREYIQNAADQIDKAVLQGLFQTGNGEIHINIDARDRQIVIEDNATGIPQRDVLPLLQNIAQSSKVRGVDKGFRGIGRLGGLAYCDLLIFECSARGESVKSRLSWNASRLKAMINDRSQKSDATDVISAVTELVTSPEPEDSHYFKVILQGVTNDELLNRVEVNKYLSMVAPLPFPARFLFRKALVDSFGANDLSFDEYRIYLDSEQLFKGYTTYIFKGDGKERKKEDEIFDIETFKEYASDGKLLYWGWHSLSYKNQSINQVNYARGFRLRKANIQIGNEYTLLRLHRDRRFQFYFYGEIHAVHPDLIPNSRRDYFTENEILREFESGLKRYFHAHIHRLCYAASEINSSVRKIEELRVLEEKFRLKSKNGFIDGKDFKQISDEFDKKKSEASKAQKRIQRLQDETGFSTQEPLKKILSRTSFPQDETVLLLNPSEIERPKFRAENLSSLTREQRKFAGRMFSIIREVLDPMTAENLIQKIEEELR